MVTQRLYGLQTLWVQCMSMISTPDVVNVLQYLGTIVILLWEANGHRLVLCFFGINLKEPPNKIYCNLMNFSALLTHGRPLELIYDVTSK
jgi:hypothetical protein